MTLHKLSVGDGYTYLTRHVAGGDCDRERHQDPASYYTEHGNPPGVWGGNGVDALGLTGAVTETQMRHLFGSGMHPDADRIIDDYLRRNTHAGMTEEQLEKASQDALRAATLGRRFPVYTTLEHFDARVDQRMQTIRTETGREPTAAELGKARAEEARRARGGVAGYDLVFTPVKSLVLLWALDERQWVRDAVQQAHEQARDSALALLEEHAAFTRGGDVGQAQLATKGLLYARFDHYDSRDGDPNLHTHVAIPNKIQGVDGVWRSVDGRALYRIGVAASEHYNSTVETVARDLLGVGFEVRADTAGKRHPIREVAGMPLEFIRSFSSRRAQIEARYDNLIVDFRRSHGHDPDHAAAFKLAEQANLATRGPKQLPRSLAALRTEWTQRLTAEHGRTALRALTAVVPDKKGADQRERQLSTAVSTDQIAALAALTVGRAEMSRSTWTVWNLRAEADRLLREPPASVFLDGLAFTDTEARDALVRQVVEAAVEQSTTVTVQPELDEPAMLRRPDGESVFTQHGGTRYTSRDILDAEQRLLTAARTPVGGSLPHASVQATLDEFEAATGTSLDAGQRAMVVAFATDPNMITVGLGPAGAGKTTTMRAYQHVLDQHGRRLIPLATSAAAAAVLSSDLGGTPAENVHKFVYEHLTKGQPEPDRAGRIRASEAFFHVHAGDVVLVDEAGLAGTRNLDTLREVADRYGATVRLLGDHRQLSAVESGGALRLLATEIGAVELTHLHRFASPAEADATRALREGDTAALDFYTDHDRIVGGSVEAMIEQAYNGWHADMTGGQRTLMVASTSAGVTALSARARADRVTAGQVEQDGVTLHDGNQAGRGDWIVTRDNDRKLTVNRGKDWVRNGDAWTVTARRRDGSLKVQHHGHGGTLILPKQYVAAHVELHYATTVHRAQGATVDTAHALVTDDMTRETLYVAATRARQSTTLYAVTHRVMPQDQDARMDRTVYDRHARAAREVLETVLATEGAQPSATESIARAREDARSLATLLPRLRYAAEKADDLRLRALVADALPDDVRAVVRDPAWSSVVRTLRTVEGDGWDLPQVLAGTARRGALTRGDSPAKLLAWRIDEHVDGRTPAAHLAQPTVEDATRYAALLAPKLADEQSLDAASAVRAPKLLHTDPISGGTDYQRLVGLILGDDAAERAADEPAWPALRAAIRRAENAGHESLAVVANAVLSRPLDDVQSTSQVLAWRINQHLEKEPAPADPDTDDAWRALAWTVKAAETNGQPAELLLSGVRAGADLDGVRQQVHTYTRPQPAAGPLPWLSATPDVAHPQLTGYLGDADKLVLQRVHDLSMHALLDRPAWLAGLGDAPTTGPELAAWLRHVGTVAAFRDQHQVTLDDPARPLGAYLPAESAGHRAYLHAADAVLAARHPHHPPADTTTARVAADVYLALPDNERETITRTIAEKLGGDWLGPRHDDADTLLTAPVYAAHLHTELVQRGHLHLAPEPAPQDPPPAPPTAVQVVRQIRSTAPMEQQSQQAGIQITW
ncbi:MobF family relaxase [Actinoplanes regularis]|uniref:Conjugative relaxase domain-containing protein, TrwC/TraI family n=1 Tax=Actinoplanes regularis TaxID=52697 RepID=A0A238XHI8_9ACTN|nr:MobF family relaxase [Actinoplanes regularis]SNR58475.1 conjugative relaxase domain-containing protein, TrwC/TraI family [Actinoplanes regularis]